MARFLKKLPAAQKSFDKIGPVYFLDSSETESQIDLPKKGALFPSPKHEHEFYCVTSGIASLIKRPNMFVITYLFRMSIFVTIE